MTGRGDLGVMAIVHHTGPMVAEPALVSKGDADEQSLRRSCGGMGVADWGGCAGGEGGATRPPHVYRCKVGRRSSVVILEAW